MFVDTGAVVVDTERGAEQFAHAVLASVRPAGTLFVTFSKGSVNSEGDTAMRANLVRSQLGVDGQGIRVGVISDSLTTLADAVTKGDLPADLQIVNSQAGNGNDEGRAMSEIIYDLAPGADLLFHTGLPSSLDMIAAIQALTQAGATIIVDDVEYFNEPVFEPGPVAQAVQEATNKGVTYITAAGNNAQTQYNGVFTPISSQNGNSLLLRHDFGGGDSTLAFQVLPFQSFSVFLQWPNPFDGSANTADYDLFVMNEDGTTDACTLTGDDGSLVLSGTCTSTDRQIGGNAPPIEQINLQNNSFNTVSLSVVIAKNAGAVVPLSLKFNAPITLLESQPSRGTIFGHPCLPDVLAVAAVDANNYSTAGLESFSSQGPCEWFFPTRATISKPDVAAADGVMTSLDDFSPFFGTSAAAPHAAAVAALLTQATGGPGVLKNSQITDILRRTAVDFGAPGFDSAFGFGALDALQTVRNGTLLSGGGFATFWVGLKKTDNEGTLFDLRAELYRNNTKVASGDVFCIAGIVKAPEQAKEVTVLMHPLTTTPPGSSSGELSLKVLTRIGTTKNGTLCEGPNGNRNSASGLRLYYDAKNRASRFSSGFTPSPSQDFFLHEDGKHFFDATAPVELEAQIESSGRVNAKKGNPWQEIGTWQLSAP